MTDSVDTQTPAQRDAVALTNHAREVWTTADMFCGNCGAFAFAVGSALKDVGHDGLEIVLFYNRKGEERLTAEEIVTCEAEIYHVALRVDGQLFDGDGPVTEAHIVTGVCSGYRDPSPGILALDFDDMDARLVVEDGTNWQRQPSSYLDELNAVMLAGPEPTPAA